MKSNMPQPNEEIQKKMEELTQKLVQNPILLGGFIGALLLFLFAVVAIIILNEDDTSLSKEDVSITKTAGVAPSKDNTTRANLQCRYIPKKVSYDCVSDCPPDGTEIMCGEPDIIRMITREVDIRKWEEKGIWKKRKDSYAVFNIKVQKAKGSSIKGKTSNVESSADVYLTDIKNAEQYQNQEIYGVGKMYKYDEGIVWDDVYLKNVTLFSEKEYVKEVSTLLLQKFAKQMKAEQEKMDIFDLQFLTKIYDSLGFDLGIKEMHYVMGYIGYKSEREFKKDLEKNQKAVVEYQIKEMTEFPYKRYERLGFTWDDSKIDSDGWALKTSSRCGKSPDIENKAKKKAVKKKKKSIAKKLTTKIMAVPVRLQTKEFDAEAKEQKFTVTTSEDYQLSGKPKVKVESFKETACCTILGNCTVRLFGCNSNERKRVVGSSKDYSWKDGKEVVLTVPTETELSDVTGVYYVQLKGVARICAKDESEDPHYYGSTAAIILKKDDNVVYFEDKLKVTAEESVYGGEHWVEEKLKK